MQRTESAPSWGFENRSHAGRVLATHLGHYRHRPDVLVLGLPRGGIPVAFEVARALNAPLDIFLVRKLGVPGNEELAMGALASGGVQVINRGMLISLGINTHQVQQAVAREQQELDRQERSYRDGRSAPRVEGKTVILIDDGLATGSTMEAATSAIRAQRPARLVVAVPTGAVDTCRRLEQVADEVVCAITPSPFYAVGVWFRNFDQVTDQEVRQLLRLAGTEQHGPSRIPGEPNHDIHRKPLP